MPYDLIKLLHQTAVTLSLTGFIARGLGSLRGDAWVQHRLVRVLPQVVDTVLLASGLTLAWLLKAAPHRTPWLAAKLVAVVLYIVLGTLAMRPGRPVALRWAAFAAALVTAGWIVSVAVSKQPLGFLSFLLPA